MSSTCHANSGLTAKIGPSILNSDLSCLADECIKLVNAGADYLHLDVMDGKFVSDLTFGAPVVKCLRDRLKNHHHCEPVFDMHMMVNEPINYICPMAKAGATIFTFHLESKDLPEETIRLIKEAGMKVGIAIKPGTSVDKVINYVKDVDMVLVMTVEPGRGGQKFMPEMMVKVNRLRQEYPDLDIEVDGGVGPSTIDQVAQAGANYIVSGTAVITAPDPSQVIQQMRSVVQNKINFKM